MGGSFHHRSVCISICIRADDIRCREMGGSSTSVLTSKNVVSCTVDRLAIVGAAAKRSERKGNWDSLKTTCREVITRRDARSRHR